jgi:hypothetical protein
MPISYKAHAKLFMWFQNDMMMISYVLKWKKERKKKERKVSRLESRLVFQDRLLYSSRVRVAN